MDKADRRGFDEIARELPEGVDASDGYLVLSVAERRAVYLARTHVLRVRPNIDSGEHPDDRERVVFLKRRRR